MSALPYTHKTSDYKAVTGSSTQFDTTMVSGVQYVLRANVDLWWRADSSNPTAAVDTDQNHFLKAGFPAYIAGGGFKVAVIKDTGQSDGDATLSEFGPIT